jgi:hypothetical protein
MKQRTLSKKHAPLSVEDPNLEAGKAFDIDSGFGESMRKPLSILRGQSGKD